MKPKTSSQLVTFDASGVHDNFKLNLIDGCEEVPLIVTEPDGSQWVALEDYLKLARQIRKSIPSQ